MVEGFGLNVIRARQNIDLIPKPNETRQILSSTLPPLELITSASVFAFDGDRILMADLKSRGWDLPGGHVEDGERPEDTVRREVYEETKATLGEMGVLGYTELHIFAPKPLGYSYPYPKSYMVSYWALIASLEPFEKTPESGGRRFFSPEEAQEIPVIRENPELYEAALKVVAKKMKHID
jgi:8-oxo-dGTP pyrophosphatase MutT (NUDIX family)